jgi:hypothetical protein
LKLPVLAQRFGFWFVRLCGSGAAFGFRRLMRSGSSQSPLAARQSAGKTFQQQHNKALHPTAYSSVRSSLRFRRRVSLVVVPVRPLDGNPKDKSTPEFRRAFAECS